MAPLPANRSGAVRVLILGHNYAPEMTGIGPYNTDLAEHLVSQGHEVTVLTTFPHYPQYRWLNKPGFFKQERLNGVTVRRLRVILPRRRGALWRVVFDSSVGLSYLVESIGVRRPQVIVATVPTLQGGLAASLLARLWKARALLMVQDLPVEAGLAVGMLRKGTAVRVGHAIEGAVFRLATHSVVIAEQFRDSLVAQGVEPERITVIPDWVDLDAVAPQPPDKEVRRHLSGSKDGFLIVHTGAMAGKQGLRSVVDAADLLVSDGDVRIALVGDGPARRDIEDRIRISGLENIRVIGLQPADYFPRMLAAADALLLSQKADVIESVVPSKLLSYMAGGRPVIAMVNEGSVAAKLIRDARCGLVIPPENPHRLAEAARHLRENPALGREMGIAGRAFAERNYARSKALTRWTELVEGLGSNTEARR